MRVDCEVEYIDIPGEHGDIPSVEVVCSRCGHTVSSFGTTSRSIRRCLAVLREECPKGETNYYVADDGGNDD